MLAQGWLNKLKKKRMIVEAWATQSNSIRSFKHDGDNTYVRRETPVRTCLTTVTPNPNGAGDGCGSKVFLRMSKQSGLGQTWSSAISLGPTLGPITMDSLLL